MLDLAILNNATWCTAVLRAHGIRSVLATDYWSTDGVLPPFYGNFVSRTRDGSRAQFARIRELAALAPQPAWGMKDSYACLDGDELCRLGMQPLFDAEWYGREPRRLPRDDRETGLRVTQMATAADLARWETAWKVTSPSPGVRVFPPSILSDPAVTFLAAWRGTDLVGGAITNLSSGAVGLSNVFTADPQDYVPVLRDLARHAVRSHPERAVVGYGPRSEAVALAPLGFDALGPLRVWTADVPYRDR